MSRPVRSRLPTLSPWWGIFLAALFLGVAEFSCGDDGGNGSGDGTAAVGGAAKTVNTVADQAARLAAETQLRNAQSAQASFFLRNQRYAASNVELRSSGVPVSPKVQVASADEKGYEMSVEVNDQARTKLTVRKTETRTERTDSEGNSW